MRRGDDERVLTVGAALRRTTGLLERRGCESPRLDAELLLGKATGLGRLELLLNGDRELTDAEASVVQGFVSRRSRGEPLQHVLGEWGFRRLTLNVDRRALIPRPETEIVVERCLALLAGRRSPRVLDVGTGTGAIALAIADEHPGALVTGLDLSVDALALARENAERTGIAIELGEHDFRDGLPPGPWELVVSNPPYVDPGDRLALPAEVREFEPALALFGTDSFATIAEAARSILVPGGHLVFEVGEGQSGAVASALEELGYCDVRATRDLTGRSRVVEGCA